MVQGIFEYEHKNFNLKSRCKVNLDDKKLLTLNLFKRFTKRLLERFTTFDVNLLILYNRKFKLYISLVSRRFILLSSKSTDSFSKLYQRIFFDTKPLNISLNKKKSF